MNNFRDGFIAVVSILVVLFIIVQIGISSDKNAALEAQEASKANATKEYTAKHKKEHTTETTSLADRGYNSHGDMIDYTGMTGYIAAGTRYSHISFDKNWTVDTLSYNDELLRYEFKGTAPHKAHVKVLAYDEYDYETNPYGGNCLFVEDIDNGQKYTIEPSNFVLNPYWEMNIPISEIVKKVPTLCEYHHKQKVYPTTTAVPGYGIVKLEEGAIVLAYDTYTDPDMNIECSYIDAEGYQHYPLYINEKDLTVIY